MKWKCDACEQHDIGEGKSYVSTPCILEVEDDIGPDCCPFSNCGVYYECEWKSYEETTCYKMEPVDMMHMLAEICDCEKMKKLMEPNDACKLNRLAINGIIKNCPYCGKINPAYNDIVKDIKASYEEYTKANPVIVTTVDNDPVNHPSHYTAGRFETIEVIEDWGLDFCLGNAVKYISRAGKKDPSKEIEDLKKAVWYIERRIKQLEGKA